MLDSLAGKNILVDAQEPRIESILGLFFQESTNAHRQQNSQNFNIK